MTSARIRQLLEQVQAGRLSVDTAARRLKTLPYESLGFATVDHHRLFRQGMAETILCEGKSIPQVVEIARRLKKHGHPILATRVDRTTGRALLRMDRRAQYDPIGKTVVLNPSRKPRLRALKAASIIIITGGTSDMAVAEEARVTAEVLGNSVSTMYDVGVAGLHRLLDRQEELDAAQVLIVMAGMDGALPSVVGGLVAQPVIAVPTSRGYGASFGGISALLAMLNSCAAGIGVVNIDNGFGAACMAHRITQLLRTDWPSPQSSRASSRR